ncbi:MAG: hypothetical protein AAF290_14280 [Pseudomonadota bacterium]
MLAHHKHKTIGWLIDKLSKCNPEAEVTLGPLSLIPESLYSYRGYYEDVAIDYRSDLFDRRKTVNQFLQDLRECLGSTITGYKGGDYTVRESTALWVAKWGQCSGVGVVGIRKIGKQYVVIKIKEIDR